MKSLLLLVVSFAALQLQSVQALQCYFCVGSLSGDCAESHKDGMVAIQCAVPQVGNRMSKAIFNETDVQGLDDDEDLEARFKASCIQFVEPLPGGKKGYVRGCAVLVSDLDPCKYVANVLHGSKCKSCNSTLCNNDE